MLIEHERGYTLFLIPHREDKKRMEWVFDPAEADFHFARGYFLYTLDSDGLAEDAPLVMELNAKIAEPKMHELVREYGAFVNSLVIAKKFTPEQFSWQTVTDILKEKRPILRGEFLWYVRRPNIEGKISETWILDNSLTIADTILARGFFCLQPDQSTILKAYPFAVQLNSELHDQEKLLLQAEFERQEALIVPEVPVEQVNITGVVGEKIKKNLSIFNQFTLFNLPYLERVASDLGDSMAEMRERARTEGEEALGPFIVDTLFWIEDQYQRRYWLTVKEIQALFASGEEECSILLRGLFRYPHYLINRNQTERRNTVQPIPLIIEFNSDVLSHNKIEKLKTDFRKFNEEFLQTGVVFKHTNGPIKLEDIPGSTRSTENVQQYSE
jgi:hypothetical protein